MRRFGMILLLGPSMAKQKQTKHRSKHAARAAPMEVVWWCLEVSLSRVRKRGRCWKLPIEVLLKCKVFFVDYHNTTNANMSNYFSHHDGIRCPKPCNGQMSTLFCATLLAWCFLSSQPGLTCEATVIASGKLEKCLRRSDSEMDCEERFVISLTAQNGEVRVLQRFDDALGTAVIWNFTKLCWQDGTSEIELYRFNDASDEDGNDIKILDTVTIALRKSQVQLRYPITYERVSDYSSYSQTTALIRILLIAVQDVNDHPAEITMFKDSNGNRFQEIFHPCDDSESEAAACGVAKDENGDIVPNSQGFCCKCSLVDSLPIGPDKESRVGITCDYSSSAHQSAHCLRFSRFWWR